MMTETDVNRDWLYFHSGDATLFGWLHSTDAVQHNRVAVICNPLGVEYMSGHRSVKHFADHLSKNGIPTLRFDYAFSGDSTGADISSARTSNFTLNIKNAIDAAIGCTGLTDVVLIGIGLGATFAAMALQTVSVSQLVLWNPTIRGKRFVREQRLMSRVLESESHNDLDSIDSAGVLLSPQLQRDFCDIDLTELDFCNSNSTLLIDRTDAKPSAQLAKAIESTSLDFEQVSLSGYNEMMGIPTETVVPVAVFEFVSAWLLNRNQSPAQAGDSSVRESVTGTTYACFAGEHQSQSILLETPVNFGERSHLFGIVTSPQTQLASKRAFVFINCGAEHHAGPHRMYTKLARLCASTGHLAFRFDIEGIGDSFSIGNNQDNNAYSPVAVRDIAQAIEYLIERHACTEFVLTGICAGAYHSFKAAAELSDFNIIEANLVNPLVFEWDYDHPDDHVEFEAHTYRTSVREASNWLRLLKGDINYRRLIRSMFGLLTENFRRFRHRYLDFKKVHDADGLPFDLKRIAKSKRKLNIILSDGDPGLDIMKLQARRETNQALRSGQLKIHTIPNANHGLSKRRMQDDLFGIFTALYDEENNRPPM